MRGAVFAAIGVLALAASADASEKWVAGHYRADDTYVPGHYEQGPATTDYRPNYRYDPYETKQEHDRRPSTAYDYNPFAPKPSANSNGGHNPYATTPKCPSATNSGFGSLPASRSNPFDPYKPSC
jgi:hypothetical protein